MSEEKKNVTGKPWSNAGTYNSYEEASIQLSHAMAAQPTYNYKIKRTGPMGTKFTIKKRLNPELHEAEIRMNKKLQEVKSQKTKNKKSKK